MEVLTTCYFPPYCYKSPAAILCSSQAGVSLADRTSLPCSLSAYFLVCLHDAVKSSLLLPTCTSHPLLQKSHILPQSNSTFKKVEGREKSLSEESGFLSSIFSLILKCGPTYSIITAMPNYLPSSWPCCCLISVFSHVTRMSCILLHLTYPPPHLLQEDFPELHCLKWAPVSYAAAIPV